MYCKKPFGQSERVIDHLARYAHKIANNNYRIIDVDSDKVTIKYKDYRQSAKVKQMTFNIDEFIRRFSMHILPHRFTRIRHYGILSNRLEYVLFEQINKPVKKAWDELWADQNLDVYRCPYCSNGKLIFITEIPKRGPLVRV